MPSALERRGASSERFKSPQEELEYLRNRVREKENELEVGHERFESDRIAKREVMQYAEVPAAKILHEAYVMPEHDTLQRVLKLEPEAHDAQIDGLLDIVTQHGIRNALSVASRMKNPHLEDDLHRALVRYIAEGFPDKSTLGIPEHINRALHLVLFEVQPQSYGEHAQGAQQQKLEEVLASSEQLYAGFLSLLGQGESFSLEIAVPEGSEEALLYIAVPRARKDVAERLISSIFPNAHIKESRGDYNIFNQNGEHEGAYALFAEPSAFPFKTYEQFEHDPLNVLLAAFAKIAKHGEGAALQLVVGNEGDRYSTHYKKMLRALENGKPLGEALRVPETALGDFVHDVAGALFASQDDREKKHSVDQVASEGITRKIKSRIAPTVIRIVASGPTRARAQEMLANLESPFGQFDDPKANRLKFQRISRWGASDFLRDFTFRTFDSSKALPLSLSEITTLFHLTAEKVTTSRELKTSHTKVAPAPVEMPADGIVLGVNRYGASETRVRFGDSDRLRHCYVIGQTGTGKTGLIKNMIAQDIARGAGVAFIDPHGSDIEDVLAFVPPERMKDVIYFDPAYTARPMGLNMLEYDVSRPEMKTFVVDEVYGIFRKLYSDVPDAFGPMFEQYYRNAVQLVLEDPASGSTFVEIARVFADSAFRDLKLSRCQNPLIVQFWRKIALEAQGDPSLENVAPYITSKFDVFLSNDIMRPIVAQEKSAFNFREIMDGKKIFLANLSKGRLGERNASLLGLVLVSKFLQAAFSRVDTRGELPPFYLYIDEFQNFATPSIATILSEARKYKLSLTVAHQFIAQLDEQIRDSVFGNVGTKATFRIGTTDAEFLEKQFAPVFGMHDLEHMPNRTAALSLLVNGAPAKPFSIATEDLPHVDYSRVDALKELSYQTFGKAREEVEAEIRRKFSYADPALAYPQHDPLLSPIQQ